GAWEVKPGEAVFFGGAGVFHLVNDRVMRSHGLAGNQCALVLELDGRVDEGRLLRTVGRAAESLPHLRVRMEEGIVRGARWAPRSSLSGPRVSVVASGDDPL